MPASSAVSVCSSDMLQTEPSYENAFSLPQPPVLAPVPMPACPMRYARFNLPYARYALLRVAEIEHSTPVGVAFEDVRVPNHDQQGFGSSK